MSTSFTPHTPNATHTTGQNISTAPAPAAGSVKPTPRRDTSATLTPPVDVLEDATGITL